MAKSKWLIEEKRKEFSSLMKRKIQIIRKHPIFSRRNFKVLMAILLSIFLFSTTGLYLSLPWEKFSQPVFKRIALPVAIVGKENKLLTSTQLVSNVTAVKQFYLSQDYAEQGWRVDFSTEEGQFRLKMKEKEVLDKMIENQIVSQLAQERGIQISRKEAQTAIDEEIKKHSSRAALESSLKKLYGWTIDDFRDKVVIYQLLMEKLIDWHQENLVKTESYQKIILAEKKLKEENKAFDEVAKECSEGISASLGGQIGWFRKEQLVTEVAEKVFLMEPGEISEVIISPLGFHLVRVEEFRKVDPEDEDLIGKEMVEEVKLSQIYIKGENFIQWLQKRKRETRVIVLMRKYRWDKESGQLLFRDPIEEKREQKMRLRGEGDPSLL